MAVTATTTYTDLFSHDEVILDTMAGEFTTQINATTSGIIQFIPDSMATNLSGHTLAAPKWDNLDYTGATQITGTADAPAISVEGDLTTLAPYVNYEQRWGMDFLASAFSRKDPGVEIMAQVARWAADMATYVGAQSTTGAFATALATTHSYPGAGAINTSDSIEAKKLLGDKADLLKIAMMHGYVSADALKDGLITNVLQNQVSAEMFRSGSISLFLGMNTYSNDVFCAPASDVYPTYFAAPGAIVSHMKSVPVSAETAGFVRNFEANGIKIQVEQSRTQDRGGTDSITARISIAAGVQGLAWGSTANPTWTALATGSNWSKVTGWPDKNIKIVRVTNSLSA